MADFLRFKGAKSVTKQQGDEMRLRRPPNGGDTWQTKRWWGGKGKVVYITAAIFAVSTSGDDVQLVIPTDNETTSVSIRHDGAGNFTFSDYRGIDRIAVYNADRSALLTEYQFPAISGGSILKRTIAPPPDNGPVTFTGQTQLTGNPQVGSTVSFAAAPFTGGTNISAVEVQLQQSNTGTGGWTGFSGWESSPGTAFLNAQTEAKFVRGVTRVLDSNGTTVGGQTDALGPVSPSAFALSVTNADVSYAVTVAGGEFELDGVANESISINAGQTIYFDLSDPSVATHPLKIYTDATKTTEVTVGIEVNEEDEAAGLTFTPPIAGTFSYQCANHASMGGIITVSAE